MTGQMKSCEIFHLSTIKKSQISEHLGFWIFRLMMLYYNIQMRGRDKSPVHIILPNTISPQCCPADEFYLRNFCSFKASLASIS